MCLAGGAMAFAMVAASGCGASPTTAAATRPGMSGKPIMPSGLGGGEVGRYVVA
jgi:hypothetical protein